MLSQCRSQTWRKHCGDADFKQCQHNGRRRASMSSSMSLSPVAPTNALMLLMGDDTTMTKCVHVGARCWG